VFTGIVEGARPLRALTARGDGGIDVTVELGELADGVSLGESIAVAGVCLTVAGLERGIAVFELSPETLRRTRFGRLRPGQEVNVERALRMGDRLGGHVVQGHVDGLGTARGLRLAGEFGELEIELPADLLRYVVEKGSIAIDGVSLTAARLEGPTVTIAVVPHTLDRTTLRGLRPGDPVHVEVDVIAKYVERLLGRP
jgi:riboflavin synthase